MNSDKNRRRINLEDLEKENIFQVPEGYFTELRSEVFKKIEEQDDRIEAKVRPLYWRYSAAVAAMLVIGIYLAFFSGNANNSSAEDIIAEISTEELFDYLESSEWSTDELVASLDVYSGDMELFEEESDILGDLEIEDDILNEYLDGLDLDSLY